MSGISAESSEICSFSCAHCYYSLARVITAAQQEGHWAAHLNLLWSKPLRGDISYNFCTGFDVNWLWSDTVCTQQIRDFYLCCHFEMCNDGNKPNKSDFVSCLCCVQNPTLMYSRLQVKHVCFPVCPSSLSRTSHQM